MSRPELAASSAALTALIVDDEPLARAGLRHLLVGVDWLCCIGEAAHGAAAIEAIERLQPDIVFLDIHLPGLSGIEVLRHIKHRPCVVFTTAYAEHAVTAFELGALDYLLKPFGAERLHAALDRIAAALGAPAPPALERLDQAWGQGPIRRLFVRQGRTILPLRVDEVAWFDAVGDYVAIHLVQAGQTNGVGAATGANGASAVLPLTPLLHLSLNRLEARLDAQRFLRIHRTHIVNLDQVRAFKRQLDGAVVACMNQGQELAVSRARAQTLRGLVS